MSHAIALRLALAAAARALVLGALAASLCACGRPAQPPAPAPTFTAELRSWVVLGRGRHLYLDIQAPPAFPELATRVEFTTCDLRADYDPAADQSGRARVARYVGLGHLGPPSFAAPPDNRLEAAYILTLEQARCLSRDRMFSEPYLLIGPNSNAALRAVMESCGVPIPPRLRAASGLLGEFPGIDADVGPEIPVAQWSKFGVSPGARPAPAPGPRPSPIKPAAAPPRS